MPRIHKDGYPFILIVVVISIIAFSFSSNLFWVSLIITAWCVYFFRDPERVVPIGDGLVISPADGVVQNIVDSLPPAELSLGKEKMTRVSIFLNIFNVHVNRIPVDGKVIDLHYNPGKFFNASLDKASIHNERQTVLIETKDQKKIVLVQIAGLVARRIICDLEEEAEVSSGDRYGIIRFGSRVDVYLPINTKLFIAKGQTCIGGETILANLTDDNSNASLNFKCK